MKVSLQSSNKFNLRNSSNLSNEFVERNNIFIFLYRQSH